jgi:hypothetical protein
MKRNSTLDRFLSVSRVGKFMYGFILVVSIDKAERIIVCHLSSNGHKLLLDMHCVSERTMACTVVPFCKPGM